MAFRLKGNTAVAADPEKDGYRPGMIQILQSGTGLDQLSAYELKQLAPEHFVGDGPDDGALPTDWRDDGARARDAEQVEELRAYVERTSPREES